jgi:neutral ceramidase
VKTFVRITVIVSLAWLTSLQVAPLFAEDATTQPAAPVFRVGFAKRDITPTEPVPMWGYGDRHDMLSQGVLDPLNAKATVIDIGTEKLAIVGLDIGRGPTRTMMAKIRSTVQQQAAVNHVLISGSHTHHGPVIELTDREGFGKGKFDAAVAYAQKLPDLIAEAIVEAAQNAKPAKMGVASKALERYNRNRHSKRNPKPVDPTLTVLRFDDETGRPISIVANFTAHPTMTRGEILKFSADYPGFMQRRVEEKLSTNCTFIQGAAGDLSANGDGKRNGPQEQGEGLGDRVIELAQSIRTETPANPTITATVDQFNFKTRVDFRNPLLLILFGRAFFPELARNYLAEWANGLSCEMSTILLNRNIAMVSGPGEFFCNHSNRLRERAYVDHLLFFGYCNGYCWYFPTIEATSEGGYGADATVSPVEVGAGELMMNRALINIYDMLGVYDKEKSGVPPTAQASGS